MTLKKWAAAMAVVACGPVLADVSEFSSHDLGVLRSGEPVTVKRLFPETGKENEPFSHLFVFTLTERSDLAGSIRATGLGLELDEVQVSVNRRLYPAVVGWPWPTEPDPGTDFPALKPILNDSRYSFEFKGAEAGEYILAFRGTHGPDTVGYLGGFKATAAPVPEPATGAMVLMGVAGLLGFMRRRALR